MLDVIRVLKVDYLIFVFTFSTCLSLLLIAGKPSAEAQDLKNNLWMKNSQDSSLNELTKIDDSAKTEKKFSEKHVYPFLKRGTDSTSAVVWLSAGVSVALLRDRDDRYRNEWKDYQQMDRNTAHVGDLLGTGAFSLVVAGLQYKLDDRSYVYQSHLRGFAYGGLSIYTLKQLFGRQRPGNSDNRQSFPSGHTTIMFMSATHLHYAYGTKVGILGYALASLTGASRLADDVHWFSDVIGGAFLGVWLGRASFYNESEFYSSDSSMQSKYSQFQFIPMILSDGLGGTFTVRY